MVLCDTNIFVHLFNGDQPTIQKVLQIGLENICISSITLMELYRGMGNKNEMIRMQSRMRRFSVIEVDENISRRATEFIATYKLSHDLRIPDAIIGATASVYDFDIFTYNIKDFHYLPNVKLFEPI